MPCEDTVCDDGDMSLKDECAVDDKLDDVMCLTDEIKSHIQTEEHTCTNNGLKILKCKESGRPKQIPNSPELIIDDQGQCLL